METNTSQKKTLSVEQMAEELGISRGSAYALVREGKVPVIRVGRRYLVPRQAFERFLECPPAQKTAA